MHAEITVRHDVGEIVGRLPAEFGDHDPAVLGRSLVLNDPYWHDRISYATETPSFRLMSYPTSTTEFQLWVEPVAGNLRSACQTVWDGVRHAASALDPRLEELSVLDETTGQVVLRGETGIRANLARRELVVAAAGGIVAAVSLLAGWWTYARDSRPASAIAALPGIVVGALAVYWLVTDIGRGRLRWTE